MRFASLPLLILTTLAFIASTMLYALRPLTAIAPLVRDFDQDLSLDAEARFLDLGGQFLQPDVAATAALLLATWVVLAFHATRRVLERGDAQPQDYRDADAWLITGLVAGAVLPWIHAAHPLLGLLLCATMLAGFIGAALAVTRLGGQMRHSGALGFAAGWATLACCAAFATFLQVRLGAPVTLAAGVAILIAALAAVHIQLQLGRTISYSIAVIWGMIGLAAGSVAVEAALGTMAVLAIAVIAVALVRVTT